VQSAVVPRLGPHRSFVLDKDIRQRTNRNSTIAAARQNSSRGFR
jgi:hypothetical protein